MGVIGGPEGTTSVSFVILGDWTDLLLPLGVLLFAGVLALVLLSVRKNKG